MKHSIIKCEVCNRKIADLKQIDSANILIDYAMCDTCEQESLIRTVSRSSK